LNYLISVTTLIFILIFKDHLIFKDENNIQDFHKKPTSRFGGLAIIFGVLYAFDSFLEHSLNDFFIAAFPILLIGLLEDIDFQIKPIIRLLAMCLSVSIVYFLMDIGIYSLNIEFADRLLANPLISFMFTLLVLVGLINSINIVDGFNGLMLGFSLMVFLALAYVASQIGDAFLVNLYLLLAGSIFILLIANFPYGKLFTGDMGAYFIGLILGTSGLLLGIRNEEVSHWFILLLVLYPLYETVFSIYRRKINYKKDAMQPDSNHLHSLIFKKITSQRCFAKNPNICNAMTSIIIWVFALFSIIPAILFYKDQDIIVSYAFFYMFLYSLIYKKIENI